MDWRARNKDELAIEVWEKLDCESIGRRELEAIALVVRDVYGDGAVESPMRLARLLADEGAELRHVEIMEFDVERRLDDPYQAMFRNLLKLNRLSEAVTTVRNLENLRKKFSSSADRTGARKLETLARNAKKTLQDQAADPEVDQQRRRESAEIAEWLTVWLRQPELFETWLDLRQRSEAYRDAFGSPRVS